MITRVAPLALLIVACAGEPGGPDAATPVSADGITLTVISATLVDPDATTLQVEMRVRLGLTEGAEIRAAPTLFRLETADRLSVSPTPAALAEPCSGEVAILAGGALECGLLFTLPSDATPTALTFQATDGRSVWAAVALVVPAGRCAAPSGDGAPCTMNPECPEGICALRDGQTWCTGICSGDVDCAAGFECVDVGGANVCVPILGLGGARCARAEDCLSGVCDGA